MIRALNPGRYSAPLAIALLCSALSGRVAEAAPSSPELVIDAATGQVLHADEATRPWFPASTTKMMTAYVALRAIKSGEIKLETPLVASPKAAAQPPSKIGIRPGQEITLDNALKILMVKSANDLAVVIAEGVGGSQEAFARRMNAEAARLGMRESNFVNPHGLFHAEQTSSARDLALLGRALLVEFPDFRDYWGIGAVQLGQRVMRNTNGLIGRYPGAEGMKTGFICPSGFNVVALANRGGRTLIAVVLGAGSGAERTIRTAQILDKGFASSTWGPSFGLASSLAPSGLGAAPNMRNEICRKGRNLLQSEEEDTGGSIALPGQTDSGSVYAIMQAAPQPSAARSVGGRGANGRATLGPRAEVAAIPVYLGRAPGSTEVARGPGKAQPLPKEATAFAPPPAAAQRAAPASAAAAAAAQPAAGAPLQLPGLFTATPAAAAGLRSATRESSRPTSVPTNALEAQARREKARLAAAPKAAAKAKPAPKKKKAAAADDDE